MAGKDEGAGLSFLCDALASEVGVGVGGWRHSTPLLRGDPSAREEAHCAGPNAGGCGQARDSGY